MAIFNMLPKVSSKLSQYLSALCSLLFFAGAANGIRERWLHHTTDGSIHFLAIAVAIAVLISLATYLYGYRDFGRGFSYLWMGVLFSVLSFTEIAFDHLIDSLHDLDVTDILIMASTGVHCFKVLSKRICSSPAYESKFLTTEECLFLLGFLSGTTGTMHFGSMLTIIVAVTIHLMAFHMKSSISLLSAICLCFLGSVYFFPASDVNYNPYILSAFTVHLSFESLVDIYFSRLSLLETWKKFIFQGRCIHRLQILVVLVLEALFYAFSIQLVKDPDLPVYRLPIFVFLSIPWVWFHFMFIVTCWGFVGKLEECSNVLNARGELSDNSMSEVMASKGLRHFCLVSQIVMLYTLLSTLLVIASAWQETNPAFIGMLLTILPVELVMYDILAKLGKSVGGTAIGYAVVAPAHKYSPTGDVVILAENAFQAVNTKAMELISIVSRFFSSHMIHNFGTDFSSSGISADYIEKKITSFFEQRVLPGLHYDTYILYYSGHVISNGDWALTEDKTLAFESILKWWRNKNAGTGARLLLFLDTAHSDKWVDNIWKVENDFIAIQTGKLTATFDAELGNTFPLGELTKLWDDFNTTAVTGKPENYWDKNSMKVKPVYGVSREWCCFKFHEPTVEDIAQHVEQNFPRFIKPITKIFTHLPCNTNVLSIFDWFTHGCRRLKMRWFPPAVYDTGHGFKLVR
ncbi:hypothetical protein ACROYT_G032878 [Oculina patagonica]